MSHTWSVQTLYSVILGMCLALALACAGPGAAPTEYQRGTYAPPPPAVRAPSQSPGVGAPVVGQPGFVGPAEQLPRSPYKRVLPPTREPGLWGGDQPVASAEPPKILGVIIPYAVDATTQDEKAATDACVMTMNIAARTAVSRNMITQLPDTALRCLAARLYSFCAHKIMDAYKTDRREARMMADPARYRAQQKATRAADAFIDHECESDDAVNTTEDLFEKVTAQWLRDIKT